MYDVTTCHNCVYVELNHIPNEIKNKKNLQSIISKNQK